MRRALALVTVLASAPVAGLAPLPGGWVTQAAAQDSNAIVAPISALYAGLQQIQQTGSGDPDARAKIIAPLIDKAYDLDTILQASVGLRYANLTDQEKKDLLAAFRNFTIARYVSTFKPGAKTHFDVTATTRAAPVGGGQVVTTHIGGEGDPSPTEVDYVMHQNTAGWQVVDVLLNAHISQAAAQRADFRTTLEAGGAAGLVSMLNQKAKSFMAG